MQRTKTNKIVYALSCDPSFTAFGWVVIEINSQKVIDSGCIKTAPEAKKKRIRKSDDRINRIQEINKQLLSLIEKYDIRILLSECPHGSQNASAAVMIGAVLGLLQAISDCINIPIEWYSEEECKKFVLTKRSASKTEMIEAIKEELVIKWRNIKYIDEAVADASAVYLTAVSKSELLKFMKHG